MPYQIDQEALPVLKYREPALTATSLLAPAVGTLLLFFADLTPAQQAAWNAAAVAAAGLVTAAIAIRERLAPAILGAAQALISILTVYGFGLTAEQSTGVMALVSLVVGAYIRTQITVAPAPGRHEAPA